MSFGTVLEDGRDIPCLAIGAILGDSDADSMQWSREVSLLARQVASRRAGIRSPLRLNVVFHIDGRMAPNDFVGIRTGTFNRRKCRLVVQAAVARVSAADRRSVLIGLLEDAIDEAEEFASRKQIAHELTGVRSLLAGLPRTL